MHQGEASHFFHHAPPDVTSTSRPQLLLLTNAILSCLDKALAIAQHSHNTPEQCSLPGRAVCPRSRAMHVHTPTTRPFTCPATGTVTGSCERPRSLAIHASSILGRAHTLAPWPCARPCSRSRAVHSWVVCTPSFARPRSLAACPCSWAAHTPLLPVRTHALAERM